MSDRHARTYKPAQRHAVLVVDSVKTLANFVMSSARVPKVGEKRDGSVSTGSS